MGLNRRSIINTNENTTKDTNKISLSDYQKENEKLRNVLQNQEDTFRAVIDVKNMGIDLLQDKLQNLIESTSRTYFPFIFDNLLDTFLPDSKKKEFNKEVQRGSYKGWLKVQRDLFKLTPFHNVYEQYYDSKSKTRYFKNQIMKENN